MHRIVCLYFLSVILLASACSPAKNTAGKAKSHEVKLMPEVVIKDKGPYRESRKRDHDLIHTRLEVKFDWQKRHLIGKANLTLRPYYYTTSSLELDAKGFDIREVAMIVGESRKKLEYKYDQEKLNIRLDKVYNRDQSFEVFIDYVAKPDELKIEGSAAITGAKGLYFINADGSEANKPQQIWTQGETEASSCWFPTIDAPNERMTQEIYITVDTAFVTLSNGTFMYSRLNADGTRTDYWKQTLPHAPYLAMMAIGKFAVVKDKWNNLDVNYYVEPEYEKDARAIFSNTPEMLQFFSGRLKVDYPWDKYSQVVVRDYVSGAMENTSAVIFGEFVQKTARELIDGHNEDIVAHELFHHWFGDLVTCESWSNLALNESFATYGEYLWNEHKYGRQEADFGLQNDLNQYINSSKMGCKNLIRFHYDDKEDMFDTHTYQKGGRVLHMLRKAVGDEAFFDALKLYLDQNKFKAVEIHQLRLAFEEVTGEDMNWFFNQWFLNSSHPDLEFSHEYSAENQEVIVRVKQRQDLETTPLYRLPMSVDIYEQGTVNRHRINVTKKEEEFKLRAYSRPALVNIDAEKMLLCVKNDIKDADQWFYQFYNAPLYIDKVEALTYHEKNLKPGTDVAELYLRAMNDSFWRIRVLAIRKSGPLGDAADPTYKKLVEWLAKNDPHPQVRAEAIKMITHKFLSKELVPVFKAAVYDSSYAVVAAGLTAYVKADPVDGLVYAKPFEKEKSDKVIQALADAYSRHGDDSHYLFFSDALARSSDFSKYQLLNPFGDFLTRCSPGNMNSGLMLLDEIGRNAGTWWVRMSAVQTLSGLSKHFSEKEKAKSGKHSESGKGASPELTVVQSEAGIIREKIDTMMTSIKNNEKDTRLRKMYGLTGKN
jgi:aminopeptidase N